MPVLVELDVPPYPVDASLFSAPAVVPNTQNFDAPVVQSATDDPQRSGAVQAVHQRLVPLGRLHNPIGSTFLPTRFWTGPMRTVNGAFSHFF